MATNNKSILIIVLPVLLGVGGGIGGGFFTHYFTRTRQLEKSILELKREAYDELFQGFSLYWTSTPGSDRRNEANRLIRSAKLRILLIGSKDTIKSMAEYWKEWQGYRPCERVKEKEEDAAIYQAMRSEFFNAFDLRDPEIPLSVLVPYLRECTLPEKEKKGGG
jgi:hypothetical protein